MKIKDIRDAWCEELKEVILKGHYNCEQTEKKDYKEEMKNEKRKFM